MTLAVALVTDVVFSRATAATATAGVALVFAATWVVAPLMRRRALRAGRDT